jgi:hypothetical protein
MHALRWRSWGCVFFSLKNFPKIAYRDVMMYSTLSGGVGGG